MKVVIAIDKFKGCASSEQLAQAIGDEIGRLVPDAHVVALPIADGGDGTMQCIRGILGDRAKLCLMNVSAPLPQLPHVEAQYLLDGDTAYMDLATASGLALVPDGYRDVMQASTRGTGEMIAHAINHGARHIVLGLGGSATCDGGTGILAALGFRLLDKNGNVISPCGGNLARIERISSKSGKWKVEWSSFFGDQKSRIGGRGSGTLPYHSPLLPIKSFHVPHSINNCVDLKVLSTQFTLLSDVDNPLYGDNGAACVFAPQKGASLKQVKRLDEGLRHFATLLPPHIAHLPGAGAAGGVAAGMIAFLNAIIKPGVNVLLEMAHFDDLIADADLIITGEGRIDAQTLHGKAPAGVLEAAKPRGIPVIALCGCIAPGTDTTAMGFTQVVPVTPQGTPLQQALDTATALRNVKAATRRLCEHHLLF